MTEPSELTEPSSPGVLNAMRRYWMKRLEIEVAQARTEAHAAGYAAALVDDRQKVAEVMLRHSIATGHGDTIEDLLCELAGYLERNRARLGLLARAVGPMETQGEPPSRGGETGGRGG